MNKIIWIVFILCLTGISCNENNSTKSSKNKKITKRDYSITKKNAYNDIFLDSQVVEDYILKNALPDSVADRIRSFYNSRNYEFTWFSSDGISEEAMGFMSLKNFAADKSAKQKKLQRKMDELMIDTNLNVSSTNALITGTELQLTQSLIDFTLTDFENNGVKTRELEQMIPVKKTDPMVLAEFYLTEKQDGPNPVSGRKERDNLLYPALKKYFDLVKNGSWPHLKPDAGIFKEGKSAPQIASLKKILGLTGDLPQPDSSVLFNKNLKNGIKKFQKRLGFTPDGKITTSLLKQINISPLQRVKQILININRTHWLPDKPGGEVIVVNIPAFVLHVYNGENTVFSMPVVVGKEGHTTTIFSDMLTTVVFSPYWNIPRSIVKDEIVPGIEKNQNYLEEHDMEINGTDDGLPVVRQKPGPENSLGKVKFLFPNIFNIYFHDTPAKSLFDKDVRAYSHGCIRLGDPEKMAEYLLKDNSGWTKEKIDSAMNSGEEQYVKLKDPVPVFITYYTAWVDENSQLNFRDDIYGHDKKIAAKLF